MLQVIENCNLKKPSWRKSKATINRITASRLVRNPQRSQHNVIVNQRRGAPTYRDCRLHAAGSAQADARALTRPDRPLAVARLYAYLARRRRRTGCAYRMDRVGRRGLGTEHLCHLRMPDKTQKKDNRRASPQAARGRRPD